MTRPTTSLRAIVAVLTATAGIACGLRPAPPPSPNPVATSSSPGVATDTVHPSSHPVTLRRDVRPLHVTYTYHGERHTLDDYLKRAKVRGFVVLDRDTIVDERYAGAGESTRFQSWSVAKSFTATAVGIALDEGRIHSLDDPVTGYLPELRASGYAGVSIRDVLRMSSGIDWHEGRDAPRLQVAAHRRIDLTRMAARRQRGWPPGSRFDYDSMNYFVLAWLVQRVSGMPYYSYVQARIWQPAGMASAAAIGEDGHAHGLGYCCYYATDRDYARFGLLYLRDGRAHGRSVVPASWVDRSTRPSSTAQRGYGLGWWLDADGDFMAEGLDGQYVYVSPEYDVVIVQSASSGARAARQTRGEALTAFRATAERVAATR